MILLYKMKGCPYCEKVIKFIEEKNIEYRPLDIEDVVNKEELLHLGGIEQVPFLVDTKTNKTMYESDEIVEYLETIGS